MSLSPDKVRAYKNLQINYGISRDSCLKNTIDAPDTKPILTEADEAVLKELSEIVRDITAHIEKYRLDLAAEKLYHYVWHRFADVIIEESKSVFGGADVVAKASRQWTLLSQFADILRLPPPLHAVRDGGDLEHHAGAFEDTRTFDGGTMAAKKYIV